MENPGWRKLTLFTKLILLHILLGDCGMKAGSALMASADYTKFRDIIETEGLVCDTETTG